MLDNASHLLFGPVFDTVDIGLVVLDSQGCIVGWNEWMARVSRYEARDVLGKPFLEVIPEVRHTRLPDVMFTSCRQFEHPDPYPERVATAAGRKQ